MVDVVIAAARRSVALGQPPPAGLDALVTSADHSVTASEELDATT